MPTIVTDDDIYRVNSIWMGPPQLTMFRARYVSWGVGIVMSLLVFGFVRLWFPFGLWTFVFSIVGAIALTRWIGSKLTHERPLTAVIHMFVREIQAPRKRQHRTGGAAATSTLRIDTDYPYPLATPPDETPSPSSPAEDTAHATEEEHGA